VKPGLGEKKVRYRYQGVLGSKCEQWLVQGIRLNRINV
jgi:hypothetical protein